MLLCAVLLAGLLPLLSPPARMITSATVSVNKTIAYVGDTIQWTVTGEDGVGPYMYYYQVHRNNTLYLDDHFTLGAWYRRFTPTVIGSYKAYVGVSDLYFSNPNSSQWHGTTPVTSVFLRPAPSNVKVEAVSGTTLKVSWNAVSGATGYQVWRSLSKSSGYSLVKTTTATSWSNTYRTPGTLYYFKVRTYNTVKTEDVVSGKFSAAYAGVPLAKPVLTGAEGTGRDRVLLTWNAVPGATGYKLFRSDTAGGPYTALRTVNATSLTLTGLSPGTSYWFKLMAYRRIYTTNYYGPISGYRKGTTLP